MGMRIPIDPIFPNRPGARHVALATLVGLAYWALATYSISVRVYLTWPGDGLALGVLLCTRPRNWPYYLVAIFIGNFAAGSTPLAQNLLYSAFNVFEPLFVAAALTRILGERPRLASVSRTFGLVSLTLSLMAIAILLDNTIEWQLRGGTFWRSWLEWYLSNALGMLIFAPAVVSLGSDLRAELANATPARRLEAVAILAGLALATYFPYSGFELAQRWLQLARTPLLAPSLFLIWGAVRFAMPGGTICLAVLTLLTMGFTGNDPQLVSAPIQDPTPDLYHLQLSLTVIAITVLLVSSVAAEWRASRSRLDRTLDSARIAIFEIDVQAGSADLTEGWAEMTGAGRRQTRASLRDLGELLHPDEREALRVAGTELVSGRRDAYEAEHRIRRSDGQWIWVLSRGRIVERDAAGSALRIAGTTVEITERKLTEQRLHYLATRDALTDLNNRALFGDGLQRAIDDLQGTSHRLAVLAVGLDRFTAINDSLGHPAGDAVLKSVAMRITSIVDPRAIVARPGGDDFLVLLRRVGSSHEASQVAEGIRAAISRPIRIDRDELVVTAGIGIALFPDDGDSAGTLLRNADIALNNAKSAGRDNVKFFAAHMNVAARQRLEMEQALRRGLERDQFIVHYQPEVDLATGALAGYEALARWQDPVRGLVSPQDFIPAAEGMGLMDALGERILATACRDAAAWQERGSTQAGVAVNVSPGQLRSRAFIKNLEGILAATRLAPGRLELEITEGSIIEQGRETTEILESIARLGVHLAIDDFGTGYSSLGYLNRLPIDKVKIDRSFVADLPGDADAGAIVNAIIALSHNLGLQVVAEGVETQQQVDYLRERGCDLAQGYFFGRPQSFEALRTGGEAPGREAAGSA